ncbi:MAG: lipocalin family protein [Xanthomarina gelatinilytica]|uniref:lipocalin family protein n=1 Tax=Xanthomarina gelatinilytica TaxID=1137281 RepID=UPI003A8C7CF4
MKTKTHTSTKMPMNKIVGLIMLLVLTVSLFNCSKDDDKPQPEPTTTKKLTAGDGIWFFETSSGATYNECIKTSFYKFKPNLTFEREINDIDANNDCTQQSQQANTFEVTDDNKIIFNNDSGAHIYPIISLSEDKLVLQYPTGGELTLDKTPGNYVREPTTKEKLTAGDGKWYFETPAHNTCYKKSFMRFFTGNTFIQEIHDLDSNDNCVVQSGSISSGAYELLSDTEIKFTFSGNSVMTFTIVSLTGNELILQNGTTSTIVLDKTEG